MGKKDCREPLWVFSWNTMGNKTVSKMCKWNIPMAKHPNHLLRRRCNTQQDVPPKPLSFSSSSRIMVGVIPRSLPTFLISLIIQKKGHGQSIIRTPLCLSTEMGTQLRGFCDFACIHIQTFTILGVVLLFQWPNSTDTSLTYYGMKYKFDL